MKKLKQSEVEKAALKAQENFGVPEIMFLEDPETGETVRFDMKNMSEKDIKRFIKISKMEIK